MDPDRFQMKDIKRRLDRLEKAHERQLARHDRVMTRIRVLGTNLETFQATLAPWLNAVEDEEQEQG